MNTKLSPTVSLKTLAAGSALAMSVMALPTHAGEWSANAAMTNNYIWRV